MKNGWQRKQLGELAELRGRIGWRGLTAKEYTKSGPFFLSVHSLNYGDYVDWRDAFHISEARYVESPEIMLQKDDVLICKDGAGIGKLGIVGELPDRTTINSSLLLIRSGKDILPKFLYRCLSSPYFQDIVQSRLNGATTPHLYQRDITEFPVVLPPLSEQRRIVRILDEAFAGIATATANAQKNLQNARALFASHLQSVFTHRGNKAPAGWQNVRLAELADVQSGAGFPIKHQSKVKNGIPFYKVSDMNLPGNEREMISENNSITENIRKELGASLFPKGSIIFPKIGGAIATNKKRIASKNCCVDNNVMGVIPKDGKISSEFLYFFFLGHDLMDFANEAHLPSIKKTVVEDWQLCVPKEISEQDKISAKLEELSTETQRLEKLYERKLAALAALKKSLLHQAFNGELTQESAQPVVIQPLLLPIPSLQGITPINLHAGILAIGYQAYEQAGRQWHFQHVVGEKFSHMTEALVGIDLGRNPVQDHNGPNDFPHLHKVEHRARMAKYFTFQDGQKGKVFVKGQGFESLVATTRTALGELNQKLDEVIKLMVNMDMQQAEIFATVFAAWNNLLMDGLTPTDEQIVLAARENWHSDKLKIGRERFFGAIDWIRKKNVCPQGKGKRVAPKAA